MADAARENGVVLEKGRREMDDVFYSMNLLDLEPGPGILGYLIQSNAMVAAQSGA